MGVAVSVAVLLLALTLFLLLNTLVAVPAAVQQTTESVGGEARGRE